MLSAIGITRKKSNVGQDNGGSRSSILRSNQSVTSAILENGSGNNAVFGDNGSSLHDTMTPDLATSPAVVITQTTPSFSHPPLPAFPTSRPQSGQFLGSSGDHSRSPSIASNRESVSSYDADHYPPPPPPLPPPPVPPKNRNSSDPENVSVSSFDIEERPTERNEEIVQQQIKHVIIAPVKKKAPAPLPPTQGNATPPTPPKKPAIKPPID